jgi:hypothetical protein
MWQTLNAIRMAKAVLPAAGCRLKTKSSRQAKKKAASNDLAMAAVA